MVISLQDQLKKSGLVDDKKAKQLKRAKLKQEKLARKEAGKNAVVDENKVAQQQAKAARAEKDRQLNLEKNAREQQVALSAQIKQLIETHSISLGGESGQGDKKYSFSDSNKIKHLWVSDSQVNQLSQGQIVIVKHSDQYSLVPAVVADRIAQRLPESIIFQAEQDSGLQADDPYADYQIPDDLDW
ncbi:MAG: DUF2058 domain-containing protein [Pseudohongiellaceae bacterium]